jgi:hypothetical protein
MIEEKAKQTFRPGLIAMPPLKMVLMHASDEHVSKVALQAAIKKIAQRSVIMEQQVDRQVVRRLIKYIETNL